MSLRIVAEKSIIYNIVSRGTFSMESYFLFILFFSFGVSSAVTDSQLLDNQGDWYEYYLLAICRIVESLPRHPVSAAENTRLFSLERKNE